MGQARDYFAHLGLAPGAYSEQQLADRLAVIRQAHPGDERLADATLAYCVLRDPGRQRRYLDRLCGASACLPEAAAESLADPSLGGRLIQYSPPPTPPGDLETAFCAAVTALLEGHTPLLRYSNRRRLLDLAARLGISRFEANLLIERARFRAAGELNAHGGPALVASAADPAPAAAGDCPTALPAAAPVRRVAFWLIAIGLALLADAVLLLLLRR